jgi:DNA-binding NarL/FixJ family response regulator
VRLVVDGMGNREIAETLHLSQHTVKNYLVRIFEKLGLSSRVELVLFAIAKLEAEDAAAEQLRPRSPQSEPALA